MQKILKGYTILIHKKESKIYQFSGLRLIFYLHSYFAVSIYVVTYTPNFIGVILNSNNDYKSFLRIIIISQY